MRIMRLHSFMIPWRYDILHYSYGHVPLKKIDQRYYLIKALRSRYGLGTARGAEATATPVPSSVLRSRLLAAHAQRRSAGHQHGTARWGQAATRAATGAAATTCSILSSGWAFGPEVPVPDNAPLYDRLAAFCGREPR
jgi:hypothetical protein